MRIVRDLKHNSQLLKAGLVTCLFLGVITAPTTLKAKPLLQLKDHIIVTENVVTLGDLFQNIKQFKNEAVFRSPALGRQGTIGLDQIIKITEQYGLKFDIPIEKRQITITRPSRSVNREAIEKQLTAYVRTQNKNFSKGDLLFEYENPLDPLQIPLSYSGKIKVTTFKFNRYKNNFTAQIAPIEDQNRIYNLYIKAAVSQSFKRPILTRTLSQGETIQPEDVEMKSFPKRRIPVGTVTSLEKVIGKSLKTTQQAGSFIKSRDLTTPKLVKKNQLVTILVQLNSMTIKTQGKAINDGGKDETISVMNLQSKRVIHGTIIGPGLVVIKTLANNLTYQKTAQLTQQK